MMARRFSLPFKTVVGNEVAPGPWHYRIAEGDWLRADSSIPGWDYLTALELHREISIDTHRVKVTCGLGEEAELSLAVTLSAPIARFRRVMITQPLTSERNVETVEFRVPSANVAGRLLVETEILLRRNPRSSERFAARLPGSRLFSECCTLDLEGSGSRMPMEIARFSTQLPALNAPKAPWHIECGSGDLHLPVMHELRVYLNRDCQLVLEAILKGDRNLQYLLKGEIARRLLETALSDDSFLNGHTDFEDGSLGQAASRVLRMCFPNAKPQEVCALAVRQPGQFEAMIRSRFTRDHD